MVKKNYYKGTLHRKIKQQIVELLNSKDFLSDIKILRAKLKIPKDLGKKEDSEQSKIIHGIWFGKTVKGYGVNNLFKDIKCISIKNNLIDKIWHRFIEHVIFFGIKNKTIDILLKDKSNEAALCGPQYISFRPIYDDEKGQKDIIGIDIRVLGKMTKKEIFEDPIWALHSELLARIPSQMKGKRWREKRNLERDLKIKNHKKRKIDISHEDPATGEWLSAIKENDETVSDKYNMSINAVRTARYRIKRHLSK